MGHKEDTAHLLTLRCAGHEVITTMLGRATGWRGLQGELLFPKEDMEGMFWKEPGGGHGEFAGS